jgi:hypothetical protein
MQLNEFWQHVQIGTPEVCWPWTRGHTGGYGQLKTDGEGSDLAHRVAYVLEKGPVPLGEQVKHVCGTLDCCNPSHLRAGTPEDFWADVGRAAPGACWPWLRGRTADGYGLARLAGYGKGYAHHWAFIIASGPIPTGLWVLHSCDNPPCCNPAHLRAGTRSDNMRDAASRGRLNIQQPSFREARAAKRIDAHTAS